MPFLKQSYKQKPKQWGPFSAVQSAIFDRLQNIGIDPKSLTAYYPLWESAGPNVYDYGPQGKHGTLSGATWDHNAALSDDDNECIEIPGAVDIIKPQGTGLCGYRRTVPLESFAYFVYVEAYTRFSFYMGGTSLPDTMYLTYESAGNAGSVGEIVRDGSYHNLGYTWENNATWDFHLDSTLVTSAPYTRVAEITGSDILTIAGRDDSAGRHSAGENTYHAFFDFRLSENQIATFQDNPYSLIQPRPLRTIFLPLGGLLPINFTGEVKFSGSVTRKRKYNRNIGGSI